MKCEPKIGLLAASLLLCASAQAQSLPHRALNAVGREIKATVVDSFSFHDKLYSSVELAHWAGFAADTGTTLYTFHVCPRCTEGGLIKAEPSAGRDAALVAEWSAIEFGISILGHELHKHPKTYVFSGLAPTFSAAGHTRQAVSNVEFINSLTPQDEAK